MNPLDVPAISARFWSRACLVFYVQSVKPVGRRGDWGYTDRVRDAAILTPAQQRRFAADCRAVGVIPTFIERSA